MILREIGPRWRSIINIGAPILIRLDHARNAKDASGIISWVKINAALSAIFGSALCLILMAGCTSQQQNPDELREKTAQATATLKTDAKAVAEGVREGLNRDKPLDLNEATKEQLLTLPGITSVRADRVIAGRPYAKSQELVNRHILTVPEYDRIKSRITAKN
jgi:competence protein ComEA